MQIIGLKYRSSNLTFFWRTPSHYHIFLQFLSHFDEKKNIKKDRPGFELATSRLEADRVNHYAMEAS